MNRPRSHHDPRNTMAFDIRGNRSATTIVDDPLMAVLAGRPVDRGRQLCWCVATHPRTGGTEFRHVWARTKLGARWKARRQIVRAPWLRAKVARITEKDVRMSVGFDIAMAFRPLPQRVEFHSKLWGENIRTLLDGYQPQFTNYAAFDMVQAMSRWSKTNIYDPAYTVAFFVPGARDPIDHHLANSTHLAAIPGTAAHGLRVAERLRIGDPYFPASDREHRFVQAELATRLLSLVPAHVAGMEPHYIVVDGGRIKIVGDTSAFVEALQKSLLTFPSPARKQVGVIAPHSC